VKMKVELLLLACLALAFAENEIIKSNYTSGSCFANNTNCDWLVGVWNMKYHANSYDCNGNPFMSQPISSNEICCTDPYTMLGYCISGYREDNGLLNTHCIYQQARFFNRTSGEASQRTKGFTTVITVNNLGEGLNYTDTDDENSCVPFRQLTTDSIVANNYLPTVSAGLPVCPEFPDSTLFCEAHNDAESSGIANIYSRGRRRIPASRGDGYQVTKNMNTKGLCSLHNTNCDWFAGSWDGFIATQGFSYRSLIGEQDAIFPWDPSDVRCASEPYFMPYTCDNGYSTFTGELVSYCIVGTARIIPQNTTLAQLFGTNGAFHSNQYNDYNIIPSLENGINFVTSGDNVGCIPMDRLDTDTIVANVFPTFPEIDCSSNNISPDTWVRCEENGENSVNVAYSVLVRSYGDGTTGNPDGPINSSGSSLVASFVIALSCAVFALF
jgi:hypothetical protein